MMRAIQKSQEDTNTKTMTLTMTTRNTKTQTKCLKTPNMILYFLNPDDLLIPNMMIDTSPWSSCSRRSPWLPCSGHRISSTGPSVSPFRDFSSFPAATAALACLHTTWSWLLEQLIVGLSMVRRSKQGSFFYFLLNMLYYSTLNIAESWYYSAREAGKLFHEIRICPPQCWRKKNNPRSIDVDLDIDLDLDLHLDTLTLWHWICWSLFNCGKFCRKKVWKKHNQSTRLKVNSCQWRSCTVYRFLLQILKIWRGWEAKISMNIFQNMILCWLI